MCVCRLWWWWWWPSLPPRILNRLQFSLFLSQRDYLLPLSYIFVSLDDDNVKPNASIFRMCVCVRFVSVMAARLLECACVRVLICLIVPVFIFTLQPGLMSCCSAQFCSDWRLLQYFIPLCFLHKEWYKSVGLLMIYRLAFKLMAKSMIKYKYAGGAFLLVSNIYTVYSFCYATASVWRKGSCL